MAPRLRVCTAPVENQNVIPKTREGGSHLLRTPDPWHPVPSSDLCRHQHTCTHTQREGDRETEIKIKLKNDFYFNF